MYTHYVDWCTRLSVITPVISVLRKSISFWVNWTSRTHASIIVRQDVTRRRFTMRHWSVLEPRSRSRDAHSTWSIVPVCWEQWWECCHAWEYVFVSGNRICIFMVLAETRQNVLFLSSGAGQPFAFQITGFSSWALTPLSFNRPTRVQSAFIMNPSLKQTLDANRTWSSPSWSGAHGCAWTSLTVGVRVGFELDVVAGAAAAAAASGCSGTCLISCDMRLPWLATICDLMLSGNVALAPHELTLTINVSSETTLMRRSVK